MSGNKERKNQQAPEEGDKAVSRNNEKISSNKNVHDRIIVLKS